MYPAIWFLILVVVPVVSVSTKSLFSSKLLENFSGKRAISSLPTLLICSVLTFPKFHFILQSSDVSRVLECKRNFQ